MRTPQPPHRGGACSPRPSRSRRASTSSAMTRWRATSLASIRPRPLGSADCRPDVQQLLRGFEGPQLKQGGLERVVEAFYIAKMKYEHEARLSTPGQQVGKRAGLGYGPRGRGASSAAILVMAGLLAGITSQLAFEGGVSGTSLNKAFGEAGHSTLSSQSSCPRSTRTALPASSCMDGSFWRTWSQMEHSPGCRHPPWTP